MKVVFAARAEADLTDIAAHIAEDDPAAAAALIDRIIDRLEGQLSEHPHSGRPGRAANTRELVVHPSYIAAYRVEPDQVVILHIRHTARLWPNEL